MHIDSRGAVQAARQGSLFVTGTPHGNGIWRPTFELLIENNAIILERNNRIPDTLRWISSTPRFGFDFCNACFKCFRRSLLFLESLLHALRPRLGFLPERLGFLPCALVAPDLRLGLVPRALVELDLRLGFLPERLGFVLRTLVALDPPLGFVFR